MKKVIFTSIVLRLSVAFWNGFFGPSFGAEFDAQTFHGIAKEVAKELVWNDFVIGSVPYTNFLGTVYFVTTDSLFIGSVLSCMVWATSVNILIKIMRLLSFDKSQQFKTMLVYAFLPSSIMMTSVTLREPYQLLFVNMAVYSALKIYLHKSFVHWWLLILGCTGMGLFHGGLFAAGIFIVVATLLFLSLRGRKLTLIKLAVATPIIAVFLFFGLSLFTSTAYNIDDGLDVGVESYHTGLLGVEARTHYKTDVKISGFTGLILFFPISFLQYLFEPMPWRISAVSDVELLLENTLRAWLIWRTWISLRKMPKQRRRPMLLIFLSYLVIESIWSIGTINWGTAVRHHLPSVGLLSVAAFSLSTKKRHLQEKSIVPMVVRR